MKPNKSAAAVETTEEVVTEEDLEKSLDNAINKLQKAKGYKEEEDSEDESDEEEESESEEDEEDEPVHKKTKKGMKKSRSYEDDEPDFESLSKSIPDAIAEDDQASEVLDAIPFVKAMLEAVEDNIQTLIKAIIHVSDKVENLEKSFSGLKNLDIAQAKLIKSISSDLNAIGSAPIPRKSFIGKNFEIIRKSNDGTETKTELSKAQALDKLLELRKSGKIDDMDLIKAEGRINNNLPLPDGLQELIVTSNKN